MTVVRCDMTVSLDGFVCGIDAQRPPYLDDGFFRVTQWIVKHFAFAKELLERGRSDVTIADPEQELVAERIEQTGAYVLGRRMYDSAGDNWSKEAPYHTPVFVVTHRANESIALEDGTTFHFVTHGLTTAVERAKAACGDRKVHVSGGADIVQQALTAGLIDELHLHITPVLLGQGTRLFDNLPAGIVELERLRVVDSTDATHLSFRIPHSQEG
jgi:dihydrofolate reductase